MLSLQIPTFLSVLFLATTSFAQNANPAERAGPPPRTETVPEPCPDGWVRDLDVCVPQLSEEAAQECQAAFEAAALVSPEERAQLLEDGCTAVPVPPPCGRDATAGSCTLALCELGDENLRPGVCALGDVPVLIEGDECRYDVVSTLPSILAQLAPDARVLSAELAAMEWMRESTLNDPSRRLQYAALAVDNAIRARQPVSLFVAYRFAMCE